jgi:hypothetical protein
MTGEIPAELQGFAETPAEVLMDFKRGAVVVHHGDRELVLSVLSAGALAALLIGAAEQVAEHLGRKRPAQRL